MAMSEAAIKLERKEVCVILSPYAGRGMTRCCLFFVDLHEKHGDRIDKPQLSIRINTGRGIPVDSAMAYYDSGLYVFGGYKAYWTPQVWYLDLSPYLQRLGSSATIDLPADCFTEIASMSSGKKVTRSVVLGTRICVFSVALTKENANFELFDPKTKAWLTLPKLPINFFIYGKDDTHCVYHYGVEDLSLVIHTNMGSYFIDTAGNDFNQWKWVRCVNPPLPEIHNTVQFVKSGHLYIGTSGCVYELDSLEFQGEGEGEGEVEDVYVEEDEDGPKMYRNWFRENPSGIDPSHNFLAFSDGRVPLDSRGSYVCMAEAGVYVSPTSHKDPCYERGHLRVSVLQFADKPIDSPKIFTNCTILDVADHFTSPCITVVGIFPLPSTTRALTAE